MLLRLRLFGLSTALLLLSIAVVATTMKLGCVVAAVVQLGHATLLATGRLATKDQAAKIAALPLTPLALSFDGNNHVQDSTTSTVLKTVVLSLTGNGTNPVVAFVIRRPGCYLCREHGQQLFNLAKERHWTIATAGSTSSTTTNTPVGMFGIIKETGVDDEGLFTFHQKYFPYPLFKDIGLEVYKALGNRSIFRTLLGRTSWNPLILYQQMKAMYRRIKDKRIDGNLKGEGLIQGGVLIFDQYAELRYVFDEQIGDEFDIEEINKVVEELRGTGGGEEQVNANADATARQESKEL